MGERYWRHKFYECTQFYTSLPIGCSVIITGLVVALVMALRQEGSILEKEEAKLIIKEFLSDADKFNAVKSEQEKTPLRKAIGMSYQALCVKTGEITFTEKEVDKIMNSIISSCVQTTNEMQDRLLKLLENHVS